MDTLLTYTQTEQRTFEEFPFNPIDSLLLSTIAYFNIDQYAHMQPCSSEQILLHDVIALTPHSKLIEGTWMVDTPDTVQGLEFVQACMASRRLRDVKISFVKNEFCDVIEKQFGAVTFLLPNLNYIAFRGTDGSLAGWKEDFNICFKDVLPSQASAQSYLSGVASSIPGPLVLGGHSKGGNLAEFAALTADNSIFNRIQHIFNHDGPAFLSDPSPRFDTQEYNEKLHKTVPNSSVFGLLLEKRDIFHIVKSSYPPVISHAPFTWEVTHDNFNYENTLDIRSVVFDASINDWLASVKPAERERFVNTLYQLFVATEAKTWDEFQKNFFRNSKQILSEGSKLSPETRKFIVQIFMSGLNILRTKTISTIIPASMQNKEDLEAIEQEFKLFSEAEEAEPAEKGTK